MNAVAILFAARARIADPSKWTQFRAARDGGGQPVLARSPEAVCWCAIGSVAAEVAEPEVGYALIDRLNASSRALYATGWVHVVNDREGHDAVLAVYDHAIALADAEAEGH